MQAVGGAGDGEEHGRTEALSDGAWRIEHLS